MPFFPRTEEEIVKDALELMDAQTNINQLVPGAKARFFLTATGREQSKQQALFDANLLQPYIKYADDKFLDFFGDMLKLPRIEATHAEATGNNQMFYVSSGTFGDINGAVSFTIPAGTRVYTRQYDGEIITPGIEAQPRTTYITTADALCQASASLVYVPVRAEVEGKFSSVPRNTLIEHDFTSYSLSANNGLKTTNRYAIDNGVDRESPVSYRYRLQNIFRARDVALRASIRLAALSIPGVADVVLVNFEQGPGTYALYIKGVTPTVSPDLVNEVSAAVSLVTSEGVRPFVSASQNLGLEFVAAVQWSPRATAEEIRQGYTAMRDVVEERLNTTDIGESVDFEELRDLMLSSARYALRIGRTRPNKFEEIYVYQTGPDGVGTVRTLVVGDVLEPLYNERITLETGTRYRGIQFITF